LSRNFERSQYLLTRNFDKPYLINLILKDIEIYFIKRFKNWWRPRMG